MYVTSGVQEPLRCARYLLCACSASLCTLLVVFRSRFAVHVTSGVQEPLCCERYLWCAGAALL